MRTILYRGVDRSGLSVLIELRQLDRWRWRFTIRIGSREHSEIKEFVRTRTAQDLLNRVVARLRPYGVSEVDADGESVSRGRKRRYLRAWIAEHRDAVQQHAANRRARLRGAEGSHSAGEWEELLASYAGRCAYCGSQKMITRDHRIPLTRGGSNAITNILPACGSCNSRKGALTEQEFRSLLYGCDPEALGVVSVARPN